MKEQELRNRARK